jgi:hypothetical protein
MGAQLRAAKQIALTIPPNVLARVRNSDFGNCV